MTTPSAGPLVSIVTPSYNQAAFVEQTLESVLSQDDVPVEYLVIDGGSTDGTAALLARYGPRLAYWVSERDAGQAQAINKGLRRAKGEIVAYLNSDDLYLPGALRQVAGLFAARPDVDLVYGDCQVIDDQGQVLGLLPRHPFDLQRLIQRAEFIPQPAAFWRRRLHDRLGYFDEGLHFAMDYDFFVRAGRAGRVEVLPVPLAAFRLHGGSKTIAREDRHWRECLAVSQRHGLRPWHPWFWIRRLRHLGLRALPSGWQRWVRRRLGRAQDAYLLRET
jgi:glycosyltransferase involved in cell wall biosynthesis